LSFIAGNATIWKPSPSTPLCSVAVTKIIAEVLEKNGIRGAAAGLVIGDNHIGDALCENEHVTLGK
jgi:aldehyde dehydrogenase family 7 member A1